MSFWVQAMTAAKTIVKAPTTIISFNVLSQMAKKGKSLATRYTPATTMVALWMMELTGVGPSMALGSQMCMGNMADFPQPPVKIITEPSTRASALVTVQIPRLMVSPLKAWRLKSFRVEKSKLPTT